MDSDVLRVAILGAGPIGLEAALYARYLGYSVKVLEQGAICDSVRQWGRVTLFTPFSMNSSALGVAAIEAQGSAGEREFPRPDQSHSGLAWIESYFAPLAESDLLANCLETETKVISVSRDRQLVTEHVGNSRRNATPFRVLYESSSRETSELFDAVIDATGTWTRPNWMGSGGGPAQGERALRSESRGCPATGRLTHGIVEASQFGQPGSKRVVIVGSGLTAATNLVELDIARRVHADVECVWLTRRPAPQPLEPIDNDPLPLRRALVENANRLATDSGWVKWRPGSVIAAVHRNDRGFEIRLTDNEEVIHGDWLVVNTGFVGDYSILENVQLHRCYASGGPMNWAQSIAGSGDCLQQSSAGTRAVATSEPGLFVIGAKSYGRDSRFLFATGLQQIRDVFRIIGQRETLDLYSTLAGQV